MIFWKYRQLYKIKKAMYAIKNRGLEKEQNIVLGNEELNKLNESTVLSFSDRLNYTRKKNL